MTRASGFAVSKGAFFIRMEAKQPRTPPPRRTSEQAARHGEPSARRQRRPPARDKWVELSFYVGALALIALMEWYARLMDRPRMLWAYFALAAVAGGYAGSRLRPLRSWIRTWMRRIRKRSTRASR